MRAGLWGGAVLVLLEAGLCWAAPPISVEFATGDVVNDVRLVIVSFSSEVPQNSGLDPQVTSTANYLVTEDETNPSGTVEPAVNERVAIVKRAHYPEDSAGKVISRSAVVLELASPGFGKGKVTVRRMTAGEYTIETGGTDWSVRQPYDLSGTNSIFNLKFPNGTLVTDFNFSFTTNYRFNGERSQASRQWFSLEGSVPITTPSDVQGIPGSNVDASRVVADYLQVSFTERTYNRANNFSAWGATVRTSGRLNGVEAVARYQPLATLAPEGRSFFGAEIEAGYRDGTGEWISLTQRAPFRGNVVARLGTVIEWAPRLGAINLDLGTGLRFFVRARGWADYAKDDSGQDGFRFRGFLDSELFYNINTQYRVFLRYELGSLPPDLTRSVSNVMVGIGASF